MPVYFPGNGKGAVEKDGAGNAIFRDGVNRGLSTSPLSGSRRKTPLKSAVQAESWSNALAGGTTTNVTGIDGYPGGRGLRLTSAASTASSSGSAGADKTGLALDLTGAHLGIWVSVDDMTKNKELRVFAGTGGFVNYASWTFGKGAASSPLFRSGEKVFLELPWGENNSFGTGATRSNITHLRVSCVAELGDGVVTSATWGDVCVVPNSPVYPNGVWRFTFDDGWDSWIMAAEAMAAEGVAGTADLIPELLDTPGKLTTAQALLLQDYYGWEVTTHAEDVFTGLSDAALAAYLIEEKNKLRSKGFGGPGLNILVSPGGKFDDRVIRIAREHYAAHRSIVPGLNNIPPDNPYRLRAYSSVSSVAGGTTHAQVLAAMDRCRAEGGLGMSVYHRIVTGTAPTTMECSLTDLIAQVQYAKSIGLAVDVPLWKALNN